MNNFWSQTERKGFHLSLDNQTKFLFFLLKGFFPFNMRFKSGVKRSHVISLTMNREASKEFSIRKGIHPFVSGLILASLFKPFNGFRYNLQILFPEVKRITIQVVDVAMKICIFTSYTFIGINTASIFQNNLGIHLFRTSERLFPHVNARH